MTFPSTSQLLTHLLSDILGTGTEAMTGWMGDVGGALNNLTGGVAGQAYIQNSNLDYDFVPVDLAVLSDNLPLGDGSAAPGVSVEAARSDHVHPSVGAAGGVGLVQSWSSTDDGATFTSTSPVGIARTVIDINPSPLLLNGHHYKWEFHGEWDDSNAGGHTYLIFDDGANPGWLRRVAWPSANDTYMGNDFYLEDGTGVTVHRRLGLSAAAANTGTTRGSRQPYEVLLIDLGNQ